jgi:hypothetical protein
VSIDGGVRGGASESLVSLAVSGGGLCGKLSDDSLLDAASESTGDAIRSAELNGCSFGPS